MRNKKIGVNWPHLSLSGFDCGPFILVWGCVNPLGPKKMDERWAHFWTSENLNTYTYVS